MSNNIFLNNNLDEQLLNKIFFTLINEDKWDTLFEILSLEVIDVNTKDFRGRNALFWAINKGNIVAIEKLMQLNISTEVSPNLSAINYAVYKDNVKIIKCLRNCGVNINEIDDVNSTPIIYAVLYNKLNSINYLIENGANLLHEDFLGNSALNLAHNLKIEYLIQKFETLQSK